MRARVVAVVAILVAVAAVSVAAWVRTLPGVQDTTLVTGYGTDLPAGLLAVAWTATGAALLALRPRNALGWLVVVVGVCQALQQGLAAYGGYGVALADPPWPLARWVAWPAAALWLPGLLPLPTLLLALYPNGRLPSRGWRWPVGAAAVGIGLVTLAAMLHPRPYGELAPGPPPVAAPTVAIVCYVVGGALLAAGAVVIWIGSIGRLLRARAPERQQLAWLLFVVVPLIVVAFGTAPCRCSWRWASGSRWPSRWGCCATTCWASRRCCAAASSTARSRPRWSASTWSSPRWRAPGWTAGRCPAWSPPRWSRSG